MKFFSHFCLKKRMDIAPLALKALTQRRKDAKNAEKRYALSSFSLRRFAFFAAWRLTVKHAFLLFR
jgi:hypothetical protein